jgi:hypothetical protein
MRNPEVPTVRPAGRLWLGAPALVILACTSTQAAPEARAPAGGAGWVQATAVCMAQSARRSLARRAVYLLRALDQLHAPACPVFNSGAPMEAASEHEPYLAVPVGLAARLDPAHSSRQPAAP